MPVDTALPRSMRVKEIWRYPVKSLQGEKLSEARLDVSGVGGDRCWGIRDEITGKILTGRSEPQLLLAAALPMLLLTTASLRAGAELYPTGDWNVRRGGHRLGVVV